MSLYSPPPPCPRECSWYYNPTKGSPLDLGTRLLKFHSLSTDLGATGYSVEKRCTPLKSVNMVRIKFISYRCTPITDHRWCNLPRLCLEKGVVSFRIICREQICFVTLFRKVRFSCLTSSGLQNLLYGVRPLVSIKIP